MEPAKLDRMIKHYNAVKDVVVEAMRDYAVQQTGNPRWNKACFEWEAGFVLTALAQAGYEVAVRVDRPDRAH